MSGLSLHIASLDESGVLNVWVSGVRRHGTRRPRGQLACGGRRRAGGAPAEMGTGRAWTTGLVRGPGQAGAASGLQGEGC